MVTYNTPNNTLRGNQFFRLDNAITDTQVVYGDNESSAEDVGFEEGIPKFPLAPQTSAGYLLRTSGDDKVALMHRTLFEKYAGISQIAREYNEEITVRYGGIVWLPVGAVAIAAGDPVQATPAVLDGTEGASDKAYDGDIIPAFIKSQITIPLAAYTADASLAIPGSKKVLKIISAKIFVGSPDTSYTDGTTNSTAAVTTTLTVKKDGFSFLAASDVTGANEIALTNALQGVFATTLQIGSSFTDALLVMEVWEKAETSALPAWHIGRALVAGAKRTSITSFKLVPVILRGY